MGVKNLVARYLRAREKAFLPQLEKMGQNMMSHADRMRKWAGVYEEVAQNLVRMAHTPPDSQDADRKFLKREILKGLGWLSKNKVNHSVTHVVKVVRDL